VGVGLPRRALVSVSLVSHGHGQMVVDALEALRASWISACEQEVRVWVTLNLPEPSLAQALGAVQWPFELCVIENELPRGFGANHNQAFRREHSAGGARYFVVMNPDVFWLVGGSDPFAQLRGAELGAEVGLLCPTQLDPQGAVQDFARQIITPWGLALRRLKALLGWRLSGVAGSVEVADWVNGACMVWLSTVFEALGGFDERYFMYCEDTEICLRLQLRGWLMMGMGAEVIHEARRGSARQPRHLAWHLRSLLRLWGSSSFWSYVWFRIVRNSGRGS